MLWKIVGTIRRKKLWKKQMEMKSQLQRLALTMGFKCLLWNLALTMGFNGFTRWGDCESNKKCIKKHFNVETSIFNLQSIRILFQSQSQWKRTFLLFSIYDLLTHACARDGPSEWGISFPPQATTRNAMYQSTFLSCFVSNYDLLNQACTRWRHVCSIQQFPFNNIQSPVNLLYQSFLSNTFTSINWIYDSSCQAHAQSIFVQFKIWFLLFSIYDLLTHACAPKGTVWVRHQFPPSNNKNHNNMSCFVSIYDLLNLPCESLVDTSVSLQQHYNSILSVNLCSIYFVNRFFSINHQSSIINLQSSIFNQQKETQQHQSPSTSTFELYWMKIERIVVK